MIKKSGSKYKVYSRKGKPLSKGLSKAGAVKRLKQIEYFKHHPNGQHKTSPKGR